MAAYFYISEYSLTQSTLTLSEETSRHVVQVLRMKVGDGMNLTDGYGRLLTTEIADAHKKHCSVKVISVVEEPRSPQRNVIAISLLKNPNRFEWFLEKATELGITEIVPLLCTRTEKEKFRHERLHQILISAMLQSQQTWLPILHEPIAYDLLFRQQEIADIPNKFIAHCVESSKQQFGENKSSGDHLVLIGPEGDFTPNEIDLALANKCIPVSLGATRLRTETAGVFAAVVLRNIEML